MYHALNFVLPCATEVVFTSYIRKKEEETQKAPKRREDVLAGKLVETGKDAAPIQSPRRPPRKVSTVLSLVDHIQKKL